MNIDEIASKCITGGCNVMEIQEKIRHAYPDIMPKLIIILIILFIIGIWLLRKEGKI